MIDETSKQRIKDDFLEWLRQEMAGTNEKSVEKSVETFMAETAERYCLDIYELTEFCPQA